MNPTELITPKIVDYCRPLYLIFVIGFTKTGKVSIAKELATQLDRELLIADDYINQYGHDFALNRLESDMKDHYYNAMPVIVEGILGFRLLRKMIKDGYHLPDLIIKTECNEQTIRHFYELEEPNKNLNSVFGFNRGLQKIYDESIELIQSQGKTIKQLTLNTSISI